MKQSFFFWTFFVPVILRSIRQWREVMISGYISVRCSLTFHGWTFDETFHQKATSRVHDASIIVTRFTSTRMPFPECYLEVNFRVMTSERKSRPDDVCRSHFTAGLLHMESTGFLPDWGVNNCPCTVKEWPRETATCTTWRIRDALITVSQRMLVMFSIVSFCSFVHGGLPVRGPSPSPTPPLYKATALSLTAQGTDPGPPNYTCSNLTAQPPPPRRHVQICSLWSMACGKEGGWHSTEMPSCLA